jgi:hypothetical protein
VPRRPKRTGRFAELAGTDILRVCIHSWDDAHRPGIFDGPDLAHVAAISWPWITVVVAKGTGSYTLELPDAIITVSKPFEDDDVLSYAFLAEKKGRDPANLDFEI